MKKIGSQVIDKHGTINKQALKNNYITGSKTPYTVTAKWNNNYDREVTVTLNQNNGSGGTTTFYLKYLGDKYVVYREAGNTSSILSNITIPSRNGFRFKGYTYVDNANAKCMIDASGNIDEGALGYIYSSAATTQTFNLIAQWEQLATITLNYDGGSGNINKLYFDIEDLNTYYYNAGSAQKYVKITQIEEIPTKSGYIFNGYKSQYGNTIIRKDGKIINEAIRETYNAIFRDFSATAQWEPSQIITLNKNGGSGGTDIIRYDGEKVYGPYDGSKYIEITSVLIPTRLGYIFEGYVLQSGGTVINSDGTINKQAIAGIYQGTDKNYEIIAQWKKLQKITLNNDKGNGNITEIYYEFEDNQNYGKVYYNDGTGKNALLTSSIIPTRIGYKFKGYVTQYDGNIIDEQGQINKIGLYWTYKGNQEDYTATAQWEPITYTITYNNNGGTGEMQSKTCTYDVKQKLDKNTFVKEDEDFLGWSTTQNGEVEYLDEQEVVNLTDQDQGVVNLYAVWGKVVHITKIELECSKTTIKIGETTKVEETVEPGEATYKNNLIWTSSDDQTATVENGVVKGIKAGTVTIRATSYDSNKVYSEITINVLNEELKGAYLEQSQDSKGYKVYVIPAEGKQVQKVEVNNLDITENMENNKYYFYTSSNGNYNIVITYTDGTKDELTFNETRNVNNNENNGNNNNNNENSDNESNNNESNEEKYNKENPLGLAQTTLPNAGATYGVIYLIIISIIISTICLLKIEIKNKE